ncbi:MULTISPECIES: hypothetical protein [Bacillaceae]|nr:MULTISPECIES: hypothetical protein [Bacillaceae]
MREINTDLNHQTLSLDVYQSTEVEGTAIGSSSLNQIWHMKRF